MPTPETMVCNRAARACCESFGSDNSRSAMTARSGDWRSGGMWSSTKARFRRVSSPSLASSIRKASSDKSASAAAKQTCVKMHAKRKTLRELWRCNFISIMRLAERDFLEARAQRRLVNIDQMPMQHAIAGIDDDLHVLLIRELRIVGEFGQLRS